MDQPVANAGSKFYGKWKIPIVFNDRRRHRNALRRGGTHLGSRLERPEGRPMLWRFPVNAHVRLMPMRYLERPRRPAASLKALHSHAKGGDADCTTNHWLRPRSAELPAGAVKIDVSLKNAAKCF